DVPLEDMPSGPGHFEMVPRPMDRWSMRFWGEGVGSPGVTLVGDAIMPYGMAPLVRSGVLEQHRLHKIRFAYPSTEQPALDLVLDPPNNSGALTPRFEYFQSEPRSLAEYFDVAALVELFAGRGGSELLNFEAHG